MKRCLYDEMFHSETAFLPSILTILLLGVAYNILKTKDVAHHVFHFYTHTYVFVRKIHCGRTDPNVKLNAKLAGPVWRGSHQPSAMTLMGRASVAAASNCSL